MNKLNPEVHTKPIAFFLSVNRRELKWLTLTMTLYAIGRTMVLAASYFLGRTIDALTFHTGSVRLFATLILACIVCYEVFYRTGHYGEVKSLTRIRKNIKQALYEHTSSLSFGYFADRFAGEIAHKVSSVADAFERLAYIVTNEFMENILLAALSAVTLGFIHPAYGIFLGILSAVFLAGSLILAQPMNKRANAYAEVEAKTTGTLVDAYGNISAVKVYGSESHLKSAERQIDAEAQAFRRLGTWDIITYNFNGIFIILLCLGLILITSRLYAQGIITVGEIAFIAAVAIRLFDVLWDTGMHITEFIRFRGEAKQNLADLVVAPAILDGDHAGGARPEKIGVEYRNLTFAYIKEQPVLENFSLSVHPGEKVGIVGLSGAGKTTFANLLLRFFDAQSGAILLNGTDIANLTQEFLRSHISYVSQDTSLFHATIAENIAYGSPAASQEDIERAAHLAYADDFIADLPHEYLSIVGERGVKLSGGQRQRIAIARAILADRPLFLLDEATSALDSESESKIQKGLATLIENKTVIAIAHRLSTLSRMDRIVFLENGKILEEGTHEKLLARHGKYAALWHMQAGGFLP